MLWAKMRPLLRDSHAQPLKMRFLAAGSRRQNLLVPTCPRRLALPSRRLGPGRGARHCLRLHPPFTFADSALAQRPATCRHRRSVVPPPCFLEVFSSRFMSRYLFIFFQDNLLSFIYCNKLTLASFSPTDLLHTAASEPRASRVLGGSSRTC